MFQNHPSPRLPHFSNGGSRLPRLRLPKQALSLFLLLPWRRNTQLSASPVTSVVKRTRIWLCLYQSHPRLSLCPVPWIVTDSLLSGLPASTLSTPRSPQHLIFSPLRGQSDALSFKNKSQIKIKPLRACITGHPLALRPHLFITSCSPSSSHAGLPSVPCTHKTCCHPMVLALVFLVLGGIFPDSQVMNSLTTSVLCSDVASSEPASWPLCLKL